MQSQLFMGSLEPNMTESFIMTSFHRMGTRPQVVKVVRNRYSGEPAGYAFIHFQTEQESIDAMHKLNGKPIPGTFPVVRFRLNTASKEGRPNMQQVREFSIYVGDLTPDVDDYSLYKLFASKYSSIKTAKVILDSFGYTRGYGFVRFGNEEEMRNALSTMNGYKGLGSKPLKISSAVPNRTKGAATQAPTSSTNSAQKISETGDQGAAAAAQAAPAVEAAKTADVKVQDDDLALVELKRTIDVDQLNQEFLNPEWSLWDSLESSKWFPQEMVEVH